MPITARESHAAFPPQLEFEAFKPLPCGCVAAKHRTIDPGLAVVSLEAKGPYCADLRHVAGRLMAVPSAATTDIGFEDDLDED